MSVRKRFENIREAWRANQTGITTASDSSESIARAEGRAPGAQREVEGKMARTSGHASAGWGGLVIRDRRPCRLRLYRRRVTRGKSLGKDMQRWIPIGPLGDCRLRATGLDWRHEQPSRWPFGLVHTGNRAASGLGARGAARSRTDLSSA